MKFKNKKVLVYGLSTSGKWVSKLLTKFKANVFLYDDDLTKLRAKNLKNCYLIQSLDEKMIIDLDYLIVSPSIEKDNKYLTMAKKYNKKIYSELEFAALFCKEIVTITGTNGKTTTTELVAKMLNKKHKAVACGNIGYSLSQAVIENKRSIKVVEVSSFMLENAETFSPKVATILNIEEDHLIRHKTMEEYTNLKLSIFKNLKPIDYAVVNLDNQIKTNKNCKIITYSYNKPANVNVKNGYICLNNQNIIALNQLKLKGKHNVYNVMCAICFAYVYKVKLEDIKQTLLEFQPEKFRIEKVAQINGVNYINDSKSTNIASTVACVNSVKGSIILILCGSKKMLDYSILFQKLPKRVKQIIVFGEITEQVKSSNIDFKIEVVENMQQAVDFATKISLKNDTVILSPSSASYDQYSSYVERGEHFNNVVNAYESIAKKK